MEDIASNACEGLGTETSPCKLYTSEEFNFGVDTSSNYFLWKKGYFTLGNTIPEIPNEIIIVTTDYGYITYCSEHGLDFTDSEDVKAYIIASYDGDIVYLSRVTEVPPAIGLILKVEAGEYDIPFAVTDDCYVVNMLVGVNEPTVVTPTEGIYTNFILGDGNRGLGFYRVKEDGTIAAHRAYLQLPTAKIENGAKYFRLSFDDGTTAIQGVETRGEDAVYYDLQGRRYESKPAHRGVYILNGKKVVVR